MNKRDEKRLNELLEKKEAEEKAEKEFLQLVNRRKKDIYKIIGLTDIAQRYGCTVDELLKWFSNNSQVEFYRRKNG